MSNKGGEQSGGGGGDLAKYREKRNPALTNEPFSPERKRSSAETRAGRFVIHLHDASRTHYDLRLEVGGTLKSFAVPKGPSLDPEQKHLAVHTEDHPLEYLDFEKVIPDGNYGAGPMIIWDQGRVSYLETSAEEGLRKGKVDFVLSGFKVRGRFALIETERRKGPGSREDSKQWLLVKKQDEFASATKNPVVEQPYSVVSAVAIDEVGRKDEVAARLEALAAELGAPRAEVHVEQMVPMLCATEPAVLDDEERLYELKIDGVRIVADKHGDSAVLRYRNGRSAGASYPEIARAVAALSPERLVLDGEIVAFDERGRPNFQRILPRIQASRPRDVLKVMAEVPVCYLVFDVLAVGQRDLRPLPLFQRKQVLLELLRGAGYLRALDHVDDGALLHEFCKRERLEGIVSKLRSSPYRPGPRRTTDWVKIKLETQDEFVVVGWLNGKGKRNDLGALCIASYSGSDLVFRGRVGSGLDHRALSELGAELLRLEQKEYPAVGPMPEDVRKGRWVRPELVVSVKFHGFTEEGRLRAPVYCGIRRDIAPGDCRATPPEELIEKLEHAPADAAPEPEPAPEAELEPAPRRAGERRVKVTNRNKIFWPDEGYTKGDLVDYYEAIAPVMVPFLKDRPLVLVRQPDGIKGKSFFQWNVPEGTPEWIRKGVLYDPDDPEREKVVFIVDDAEALRYIPQLGCIALHVLACREATREQADFLTIDFDIGEQPLAYAVELALTLREILDGAGLRGYPKTSGQKGLHVLVPLGPGVSFDTSVLMAELLGRLVTDRHSKIATMERMKEKRGPRVYVDTGQTGQSRSIVAPYSVRAWPGATVSTPLDWEELHSALDPKRFTIMTVPARLAELPDPLAGLLEQEPDIAAAVGALGQMAAG
ncbi:MAG TPA: DNA ligase D [Polyangiaceae bacterium]|nr:DNA ligase D [Polyangiaceae bacterium]